LEESNINISKDQSICCINESHEKQGLTIDVVEIIHNLGINTFVEQSVYWIDDTDVSSSSSENKTKDIANVELIHDKLLDNGKHKEPDQSFISEEVYVGESTILEFLWK